MPGKLDTQEFIKRATAKHGSRYSYLKTNYVNMATRVIIGCSKHGDFEQNPRDHWNGAGCSDCTKYSKNTKNLFVAKAKVVHKGKGYDYSKVVYVKGEIPVIIGCPTHGDFKQKPVYHLVGNGCQECGGNIKLTQAEFIDRAKVKHGDKYDYSETEYCGMVNPVRIICPEHGEFSQLAYSHVNEGKGCFACAIELRAGLKTLTQEDFLKIAEFVHGDRYDYSDSVYVKSKEKIDVRCKTHGVFSLRPNDHLNGVGCAACMHLVSKQEMELTEFIKSLGFDVTRKSFRHDGVLREGDIVIESRKIIIEYNGLFWHSSYNKVPTYHRDKRELFEKIGYRSIMIWSDEWINDQEKVKDYLKAQLNLFDREVGGRKADLQKLGHTEASAFFKEHHLQGGRILKDDHYGLIDNTGTLVACASFATRNDRHELIRFAQKRGVRVAGGLGRLIRHWRINNPADTLVSFCDLDKFSGNGYKALGFMVPSTGDLSLAHWFTDGGAKRENRQKYMKHNLPDLFGPVDIAKTAEQICKENGVYSVYGSGTRKYELHPA